MIRYQRAEAVLWRRSLDAVLVLGPGMHEPVTLAGTAPAVWHLLVAPRSLTEMADELARRHRADPAVVEPDVEALIGQLLEMGVVERLLD